jgi:hypothetical protein
LHINNKGARIGYTDAEKSGRGKNRGEESGRAPPFAFPGVKIPLSGELSRVRNGKTETREGTDKNGQIALYLFSIYGKIFLQG